MKYLNHLDIRKVGERKWELLSDFAFESDYLEGVVVAPKGFVTNFASIPRVFWRLYPPVGNYDEAAVIHDAAYDRKLFTISKIDGRVWHMNTSKTVSDLLFHEALQCETFRKSKVGPKTAETMYFMVRNFGNYPKLI